MIDKKTNQQKVDKLNKKQWKCHTADSITNNRTRLSEGRKKFNVNFIVKTGDFLYNRNIVGASCIASSAELQ